MSNPVAKWKTKTWRDGYENGIIVTEQRLKHMASISVRAAHHEADQLGFSDGQSFEEALDTLEMEIEEATDDQLPSRYSQAAGMGYSLRISAEEEREMLREALNNW